MLKTIISYTMPTINKGCNKRKIQSSNRRKERQLIYNTPEWKKLSKAFKMAFPLCQRCLTNGVIKEAKHIHHKVSFMEVEDELKRKELAYNWDNLEALCVECHIKEHNKHHNHQ